MADDIITLGGRRGQFEQDRDEAIEELFHAEYPGLVRIAFALVGDENVAGQAARQAFLRLLRRWRRLGDPREAPAYLQGTVTSLAREIGHGRGSADGATGGQRAGTGGGQRAGTTGGQRAGATGGQRAEITGDGAQTAGASREAGQRPDADGEPAEVD